MSGGVRVAEPLVQDYKIHMHASRSLGFHEASFVGINQK